MTEEIILSIVITGHGCENLRNPWADHLEISDYFRNKVRVYSTACVPDISSLLRGIDIRQIMNNVSDKFDLSDKETSEVVNAFKEGYRETYINNLKRSIIKNPNDPGYQKAKLPEYLNRSSNLITYLSNKTFFFDNESWSTELTGISVSDIRVKITNEEGNVTYRPIRFSKRDLKLHNLIHKDGVETILETFQNKLRVERNLEDIFNVLGFDEENDRLQQITLYQLFAFFKELNISYVNIFDLSCRSCQTGNLDPINIERIYSFEADFNEKPFAFGKTRVRNIKNKRNPKCKTKCKNKLKNK
jgi:hypothetical protein